MIAILDIDELRSFATLSSSAAEKLNEANSVMNTVVSQHDWKCPERVPIDETLEGLKENVNKLSDGFQIFSARIVELANGYTEFINEQMRFNSTYMDGIANHLAMGSTKTTLSAGNNIKNVMSEAESSSCDISNIVSLHGYSHGISILDFEKCYGNV